MTRTKFKAGDRVRWSYDGERFSTGTVRKQVGPTYYVVADDGLFGTVAEPVSADMIEELYE